MKRSLLTLTLIAVLAGGVIIQQDPIFKDRTNIKSESGKLEGYIQPDPVFKDKMNVYDKGGKLRGYIQQDPMDKKHWQFEGEGDHGSEKED
jgi:hypothetical protein